MSMIWHRQRQKNYLQIKTVFKKLHGLHEAAFCRRHNQINGVEVFFAIKASCQVVLVIGGGMKVGTHRAPEALYLVVVFQLQLQQIANDSIDGDLIAQDAKKIGAIVFSHDVTF
jgi:hypothetical protein